MNSKLAPKLTAPGLALVSFVCALLASGSAYSQAKVGSTGMQTLELEISARGMAMGGAFTAVVDDISAVFYNPAGLPFLYSKEFMATHITLPVGITLNFAALAIPLESIGGVVAFSGTFLGTGDIPRTTYNNPYGVDEFGNQEFFSAGEYALGVSYGRYLTDRFSFGFTVKYIGSNLEEVKASSWAADVGTIYNTGFRDFKVAMSITNFGPDMRHLETPTPLPINFHFGASINMLVSSDHLAILAMEGSHPSDNLEKYQAGIEYWYLDKFAIRGGARLNNDLDAKFSIEDGAILREAGIGLTGGFGLRWPVGEERELRFDYAYQDYKILSQVHRFTFSVVF